MRPSVKIWRYWGMGNEWKEYRLGEITKWYSGGTPPKSNPNYWDGDIPWISASSMSGNRYGDSKLKLTDEGLEKGSRLAPKNSILLLVRGSILHQRIPVGITTKEVAFNQDVKALIVNESLIDHWFLLYWFMSKEYELLRKVENTGIGAGKFDTNLMKNLPVKLPSLSTQKRIASVFKTLDDKIALNRQQNATLEAMAQALFRSWFVDFDPVLDKALAAGHDIPEPLQAKAQRRLTLGDKRKPLPPEVAGLFPDRFVYEEEVGWVPEGWVVKPLDQWFEINPRISLPKGTEAKYLEMKGLPTEGYSASGSIKKEYKGGAKFQNGDVLLARITPCLENGKTGIVDFLDEGEIGFGSTEFIVMRGKGGIQTPFVACLARDDQFRKHCIQSMVGSSGRQRVQHAAFSNFHLAIPGKPAVLKTFHGMANQFFTKMTRNSEESEVLNGLRDTLLPKLISGELQVNG